MANGHGGYREGAGRANTTQERLDLEYWKGRHEQAKALAAERENEVALGQLVHRDHVVAAAATAMAAFVQHVRSLPDTLERQHGLQPKVVEAISLSLDAAMSALADDLKALADLAKS